ncbi:DUF1659 domain-containing protein [Alkalibacillus aidingensis]|uniref:DUF1659 domain-containing protein n=1 Tax=Alkalibacillus aidingensis TaxID=2747607 RepID=UPI0016606CB4|nr:DUF1659 domain-containing protein [Alkalibacillus aidingensis]
MAIEQTIDSQLQLVFVIGFDNDGGEILARKNYNNIKPDVETTPLNEVALALASLRDAELKEAFRNDQSLLLNNQ